MKLDWPHKFGNEKLKSHSYSESCNENKGMRMMVELIFIHLVNVWFVDRGEEMSEIEGKRIEKLSFNLVW